LVLTATFTTLCHSRLAEEFKFCSTSRRLRCATHKFNLVAQSILFGTDKDSFENHEDNIPDEENFLTEWQKEGPSGTLIDLLHFINSQLRVEQVECYQIEENEVLPDPEFKVSWNSFFSAFERALKLRGLIESFVQCYIEHYRREAAKCSAKNQKVQHASSFCSDWRYDFVRLGCYQQLSPDPEALEGSHITA